MPAQVSVILTHQKVDKICQATSPPRKSLPFSEARESDPKDPQGPPRARLRHADCGLWDLGSRGKFVSLSSSMRFVKVNQVYIQ